jgi:Protein of unknown function (DUF3592)
MPTSPNANRERAGEEDAAFYWPPADGWREALPELPSSDDICITDTGDRITFSLKPIIGWRFIVTLLCIWLVLVVVCVAGVLLLSKDNPGSERWNATLRVTAFAITIFPVFITAITLLIVKCINDRIVLDEYGLETSEMGCRLFLANSEVLAIRPVLRSSRAPIFDRAHSCWWPLTRGEAGYLELVTVNGGLRVLRQWDMKDLRWLSNALSYLLETPLEGELSTVGRKCDWSSDDRTVLLADRADNENRKWLAGLLLVVGFLFGLLAIWNVPNGLSSYGWASTSGTVSHTTYKISGEGWDRNSDVEIKYSYEVDGLEYANDRIWYAMRSNSGRIEDLAKDHPRGASITVYYDPSAPSRSVLIQGVDPATYGLVPGPFLFFYICWRLWKNRLSSEQERLHNIYIRTDQAQGRRRIRKKTARVSRS